MQAFSNKQFTAPNDATECKQALRGGSRTFFAASLMLPGLVRRPATALYAFCRSADDAIDQGSDRCAALADLRFRLDAIYAGHPGNVAADRAFTDCVARHCIPKRLPQALFEGFEWDASNRRYDTLEDLRSYAVRVAGTVGIMMAMIMGVRDQRTLAHACELGVAMQLTNIARDVGEDARAGRLYLPLDWMREAGIDVAQFLKQPRFDAPLAALIERLLSEADRLYLQSESGIAQLPTACRPAMLAARLLYAEIGEELRRRGYDSVNARAVVSSQRKLRVLSTAGLRYQRRLRISKPHRSLPEAEFILRFFPAVHTPDARALPLGGIESRVAWLVNLFERLESSEHAGSIRGRD